MAQRETYEVKAHVANVDNPTREQRSSGSEGGTKIVGYLSLLALALVGILIVGVISHILFGSSVSTAL